MRTRHQRPHTRHAPLALAATGILALAACEAGNGEADDPVAGEADQPGMEHIHGLGINPADDELYVATHFGLFRAPDDGQPERIGGHLHDFMGFNILGPDHFVASGHPAQGDAEHPANLGLIETTDAGETWEPVSLYGEADFHALEARHDRVYGFDVVSGEFLVSEDRETWDARGDTAMADIAVSPDDPDVLVATTEDGLQLSNDGGHEFDALDDAPMLAFVDWPETDRLVGVGVEGAVHTSSDGGHSWSEGESVDGQPAALTTHDRDGTAEVYVATHDAIHYSDDNGESFSVLHDLH
ncbi:F510_1955 family glycosylhydrolase [Haloechinothrix sp. LS1_15]|uniref:F510_1955 family glycosylhydrolase n=1 Tax=Haloechinothrix sp. LS1_15 TaxID=2652248 RepID=UPI0029455431|nr:exo-alpha-sialidase [Haloechinothrix sp. LS1_15]MDV6011837.1 exo-alpha-sialidase [Haloechinothrix sp. LS1_15]